MPGITPSDDAHDAKCLDPGAVAELLKVGRRAACRIMREAGGWRFGDSWRIRVHILKAWLVVQERA